MLNKDVTLHDHFLPLKQACWRKDQPLFVLVIDPEDFTAQADQECLRNLHIDSKADLEETSYILVNEDGLKLPFQEGDADTAIGLKFLDNPIKVHTLDDLYEVLHLSKDLPVKYIFTLCPQSRGKSVLSL